MKRREGIAKIEKSINDNIELGNDNINITYFWWGNFLSTLKNLGLHISFCFLNISQWNLSLFSYFSPFFFCLHFFRNFDSFFCFFAYSNLPCSSFLSYLTDCQPDTNFTHPTLTQSYDFLHVKFVVLVETRDQMRNILSWVWHK